MRFLKIIAAFCFTTLAFAPGHAAENQFDPPALYLQWQRDPTTTMTIHWHTVGEAPSELSYRASGSTNWQPARGTARPLAGTERWVHVVELTGLTPASDYEFCFERAGKVFKFRTMPRDLNQPVRFVTGGDVYHRREWMDRMTTLAAQTDPEEELQVHVHDARIA